MMYQVDFTEDFLRPLAEFAGFFVLLLGAIWLIYAIYEAKRRGSFKERKVEDWDFKITKFLKVLTYLGFLVGILSIMCGVGGLILDQPPSVAYSTTTQDAASVFTSAFLIIMGILTFLKPVNDLPFSSVLGLLAASAVVIIVAVSIPDNVVEVIAVFIDPKLFLIILFIIIFAIIALTVKFYIGGLMTLSKVISWPPLAMIVAAFCLVQGFLLLVVGISITGLF
ncbi:MAG: hypothetical protein EU532_11850 [Promethearchaeota archaeon]|nr:MAG: hypothetical protein EU532_11850 [Candidatus Lokiarchaeota archaeon]